MVISTRQSALPREPALRKPAERPRSLRVLLSIDQDADIQRQLHRIVIVLLSIINKLLIIKSNLEAKYVESREIYMNEP